MVFSAVNESSVTANGGAAKDINKFLVGDLASLLVFS